ncbi:MAG TPA: DUF465 domain-containing protein [Caulobacteraceae bacterium]|jgi:hypothetical protein|nr:DUF465 domain-containing protein [Caulobacteraceae bacterium]
MDGEVEDDLSDLRLAIETARERHVSLSAEVEAIQAQSQPDQIRLARLKKQKLVLKDQICLLENRLTPDIIA